MAAGTLALAGLLLVTGQAPVGQAPVDLVPFNQRNFKIPIHLNIDPARRRDLQELKLFVSDNRGRTWQETAAVPPDQEFFTYYASNDGEYWFNVCVVDAKGNREPSDFNKTPPLQKILVDTVKPVLRIVSAERQENDAVVTWQIQETNLDPATLKLKYCAVDETTWRDAPLSQASNGQTRFPLGGISGAVKIHMEVQDTARNAASADAEIPAASRGILASAPPALPASFPSPPPLTPPLNYATYNRNALPAEPRSTIETSYNNFDPSAGSPRPLSNVGDPGMRPVAMTQSALPAAGQPFYPPVAPHGPGGASSSLRVVNSTRLSLNYEVKKLGPSGIGEVELYVTRDGGSSWRLMTRDAGGTPPLTVDLPSEGEYGFTLIVKSKAGLGIKPPQPGDLPQMRVEVDTTPPFGKLLTPQPIPGRNDALVLSWSASDRNLAPNPITLQWSVSPSGPWQQIAANLPNTNGMLPETTGQFLWTLTPQVPERVYLRLIVQDTGGNFFVTVSDKPEVVDLSVPEGSLTGIAPVSR